METTDDPAVRDDRRGDRRGELSGVVTVRFEDQQVVGPGQNMSEEGIFFVADGAVRVAVEVDGDGAWRTGEVVRVQSMGEGKVGIAIRFV